MAKKNKKDPLQAVGNVYLAGFMCAGKTSTGRALARLLGVPFCDCDAQVEEETGKTVGELVTDLGLAGFRRLEAARVKALAAGSGRVVALGGGVYPSPKWKSLLNRTGRTIFLYCPWPELEGRLRLAAKSRPLLAGRWETTRLRAEKLYKKRLPFYRQADLTVSTAGLSPAQAAKIVGRKL